MQLAGRKPRVQNECDRLITASSNVEATKLKLRDGICYSDQHAGTSKTPPTKYYSLFPSALPHSTLSPHPPTATIRGRSRKIGADLLTLADPKFDSTWLRGNGIRHTFGSQLHPSSGLSQWKPSIVINHSRFVSVDGSVAPPMWGNCVEHLGTISRHRSTTRATVDRCERMSPQQDPLNILFNIDTGRYHGRARHYRIFSLPVFGARVVLASRSRTREARCECNTVRAASASTITRS
jgi:hypothetical protein